MIYRFIMISDEVDNFYREIQASPEATFLDFHKAILGTTGYPDDQMTSFFICEDNWEKRVEVTLEDMTTSYEEDSWVMATTRLSDLVEDEGQHLIYVFDPLTDRCFFIELKEIITGKNMKGLAVTRQGGNPPAQTLDFDQIAKTTSTLDTGEDFYGDDSFDASELDQDGFDMGDGGSEGGTVSLDSIDDLF